MAAAASPERRAIPPVFDDIVYCDGAAADAAGFGPGAFSHGQNERKLPFGKIFSRDRDRMRSAGKFTSFVVGKFFTATDGTSRGTLALALQGVFERDKTT